MIPKISILEKIEFQILKNLGYEPSNEEKVKLAQSLLNAFIGAGDVIVDANMPTTLFGADLDWSAGGENDSIVSIELGTFSVEQDLENTVNTPPVNSADTTPPGEVTGLSTTLETAQSTLTWTNPVDVDFDHVEVWYGIGSPTTQFLGTINPVGTLITELSGGSLYTFLIKAVDTTGNLSTGSQITITPESIVEISQLVTTIDSEQVTLEWTDPTNADFDHVEVWYGIGNTDTQFVGTILNTETIITGLTDDIEYTILIKCFYTTGDISTGTQIAVTPTFTQVVSTGTKLVASDPEAADYLGSSVATEGVFSIVGAIGEDTGGGNAGAAYIYYETSPGIFSAGTKIVASDGSTNAVFGKSVDINRSITGDYSVVGADGADGNGAAYVFRRNGTYTWDAGVKLVSTTPAALDYFGGSVAIDGDHVIVGAYGDDTKGDSAGAAFIYNRISYNTWDTGTKIVASDGIFGNRFGRSVAIDGDYAIVGADGANNNGAAYIFHKDGEVWDVGTKIVAPDAETNDYFGYSVAISGDYVIVGAYGEDELGSMAGAGYIFHRTGLNTWDTGIKIIESDGSANKQFGSSVSISGDYALIRSTDYVYVYNRIGTNTWDEGNSIIEPESINGFGTSTSIDLDKIIIGSSGDATGGSSSGAAFVYKLLADIIPAGEITNAIATMINTDITLSWTDPADADFDHVEIWYGIGNTDTQFVGTINNEETIITGLIADSEYTFLIKTIDTTGNISTGVQIKSIELYTGTSNKIVATDAAASDMFGLNTSIDGDYAIVGSSGDDILTNNDQGSAYIYHRTSPGVWDAGTKIVAADGAASDSFGREISISGDYVVVSASGNTNGYGFQAGAAYIFHRTGTNTWDAGVKIIAPDQETANLFDQARFGSAVSIDGDYVAIGSSGASGNAGQVYVFHRTGTNTWDAGTIITKPSLSVYAQFGLDVAINGNYLVVGKGQVDGIAYIYYRTGTTTWDTGTWLNDPTGVQSGFGNSVTINGDYAIIGNNRINSYAGSITIFHKTGTTTWDTGVTIIPSDSKSSDYFSNSVSISGDIAVIGSYKGAYIFNRTGENTWDKGIKIITPNVTDADKFGYGASINLTDICVGAYADDSSGTNSGAAYLYDYS